MKIQLSKASAVDSAHISMNKLPSLKNKQQRCSRLGTSTSSSTAASLPVTSSAALMQSTSSNLLTAAACWLRGGERWSSWQKLLGSVPWALYGLEKRLRRRGSCWYWRPTQTAHSTFSAATISPWTSSSSYPVHLCVTLHVGKSLKILRLLLSRRLSLPHTRRLW